MREVTPETAADYLRETGRVPGGRDVRVQALGGGVSNVVMRVDVEGEAPFVLKQARERLRTKAHWVSRLDRIWTETGRPRPARPGSCPDRDGVPPASSSPNPDDFLFAMTCAPDDSVVWKERLLAGEADAAVTRGRGRILGTIHVGDARPPRTPDGPLGRHRRLRPVADRPVLPDDRPRPPRPRPRDRRADRLACEEPATAHVRPRRLQPQEHPGPFPGA